ncbi:hypothetical protein B0I32_13055 [Nonomuraea fuscirosea]|uniref:Uncharacterized protein n=1 Tax=Nonomuraea fuscirosea TaxID=1291556 RepID=A0A2T0M5M8_9ACTN|nr:hypothetical protein B0I32_13055 [Nonomuraea fuscirosea]
MSRVCWGGEGWAGVPRAPSLHVVCSVVLGHMFAQVKGCTGRRTRCAGPLRPSSRRCGAPGTWVGVGDAEGVRKGGRAQGCGVRDGGWAGRRSCCAGPLRTPFRRRGAPRVREEVGVRRVCWRGGTAGVVACWLGTGGSKRGKAWSLPRYVRPSRCPGTPPARRPSAHTPWHASPGASVRLAAPAHRRSPHSPARAFRARPFRAHPSVSRPRHTAGPHTPWHVRPEHVRPEHVRPEHVRPEHVRPEHVRLFAHLARRGGEEVYGGARRNAGGGQGARSPGQMRNTPARTRRAGQSLPCQLGRSLPEARSRVGVLRSAAQSSRRS